MAIPIDDGRRMPKGHSGVAGPSTNVNEQVMARLAKDFPDRKRE